MTAHHRYHACVVVSRIEVAMSRFNDAFGVALAELKEFTPELDVYPIREASEWT
jgi:hypothetical protein